jgi:hypothetical protein
VLYESNCDKDGLHVAWSLPHGPDEEFTWRQRPGFRCFAYGEHKIDKAAAASYIEIFNGLKEKYELIGKNCQLFAQNFLANLVVDSNFVLPVNADEVKKDASSWACSASIQSSLRASSPKVSQRVLSSLASNNGIIELSKKVCSSMGNKIGHLTPEMQEWMAREGTALISQAMGEVGENWLRVSEGAFTWWNLLQIPAEIIAKYLARSAGFSELQSYGASKLASFLMAAGVGALAAGPFGILGSVGFWLIAEVIGTLLKIALGKHFGKKFTDVFGESQTMELIKSIYNYFKVQIDSGMNAGLEFMVDYIKKKRIKNALA